MGGFSFPRFDDLYGDYLSRTPIQDVDREDYLDPNDPDIENLRGLYTKPSGATALYRDYLRRRPERKQPSGGELFISAMVGAIQGKGDPRAAAQISNSLHQERYNRLYQQWADEGKYIDDMSRLMEADKGREIKAVEFGIRQRMAGKKEEARQKAAEVTRAQRDTQLEETARSHRAAEEDRDLARKGVESQRNLTNELALGRAEEAKRASERANSDLASRRLKDETRLEKEAFDEAHNETMNENKDLFQWADKRGRALDEPIFIGTPQQKSLLESLRKAKAARILNKKLKRIYPHDILPEEE